MERTPNITRLIHDNLWRVLSYAFGKPAIAKFLDARFNGEWTYLEKTISKHAEMQADLALAEMATQIRVLDDEAKLRSIYKRVKRPPLGLVVKADGSVESLHFRDLTNKILHAKAFEWQLSDPDNPKVVCHSNDVERWQRAEIDLAQLIALIGMLGH
jgi:hypothetical protein